MTAPAMTVSLECRTCDGVRPVDRRTYECRFCGTVCDPTARKGLPPLAPVEAPVLAVPLALWPTTPPSNGTPQSDAAAASLTPEVLSDQQRRVLRALWKARPGGLTDEEIQASADLNPSSERPRRLELVDLGWIEDSGTTRATASGRQATVWQLTMRARQVAARTPKRAAAKQQTPEQAEAA